MNFVKKPASNLLVMICAVLLSGCTVAPRLAGSAQASWDSGVQNSGVLAVAPDHSILVTRGLVERYNALIGLYGNLFHPPITVGQGVVATSTNTFVMAPDAFEHFSSMNRWRKQSIPWTQ